MAKYTKKQRKNFKSKFGKKNKSGKRVKRSGKKLIGGAKFEVGDIVRQIKSTKEYNPNDKNKNFVDKIYKIIEIHFDKFENLQYVMEEINDSKDTQEVPASLAEPKYEKIVEQKNP
jgi:hypothetical protein